MRLETFFRRILGVTSARVKQVSFDPIEGVTIALEARSKRRCGECGRRGKRLHGREGKERRWRHLGLFGNVVWFTTRLWRVLCRRCGVRTTAVPWARVGSMFTRAFEDEVTWFVQRTNRTAVAEYFGISWVTTGSIATRVVSEKLDRSLLSELRFIGVDEIHYGRPKKFLTVVVDHEMGRVVWAGEGKSAETLTRFFQELGPEASAALEVISMDMSAAYAKSVALCAPQAQIVYDRFHVVRLLCDAIDQIRREEGQRLASEQERKAIKASRFALLKNPWNLSRGERQKLSEIQRNNRRLYRAYLLKESFQQIYDARTDQQADAHFADWYRWARRSRLGPFLRVAQTLKAHWDGIRRFIALRLTNAAVEGYNSKIRMISHRAFGFHSAKALIAMIMLLCSGVHLTPIGHGNALHTF